MKSLSQTPPADDRGRETSARTRNRHPYSSRTTTRIKAVCLGLWSLLMFGLPVSAVAQERTPTMGSEGDSGADRSDISAYPGTGHTKDGQTAWEAPYKGSGWGNARVGDGGDGAELGDGTALDGESGGEE